jgi:hypothetical protein
MKEFLKRFAFSCISLNQLEATDIEIYICPRCKTPNKETVCK